MNSKWPSNVPTQPVSHWVCITGRFNFQRLGQSNNPILQYSDFNWFHMPTLYFRFPAVRFGTIKMDVNYTRSWLLEIFLRVCSKQRYVSTKTLHVHQNRRSRRTIDTLTFRDELNRYRSKNILDRPHKPFYDRLYRGETKSKRVSIIQNDGHLWSICYNLWMALIVTQTVIVWFTLGIFSKLRAFRKPANTKTSENLIEFDVKDRLSGLVNSDLSMHGLIPILRVKFKLCNFSKISRLKW